MAFQGHKGPVLSFLIAYWCQPAEWVSALGHALRECSPLLPFGLSFPSQ